jgi:hypothetical protein
VVANIRNFQIFVNLRATDVPICTNTRAKIVGLNHQPLADMGMGSRPPDGASVVHCETDELLVKQKPIPDRQTAPSMQQRFQQSQPLGSFLPNVVGVTTWSTL